MTYVLGVNKNWEELMKFLLEVCVTFYKEKKTVLDPLCVCVTVYVCLCVSVCAKGGLSAQISTWQWFVELLVHEK